MPPVQGFEKDQVSTERFLNLRYDGTDVAVMTTCSSTSSYEEAFEDSYKREFGFVLEDRSIQVGTHSPIEASLDRLCLSLRCEHSPRSFD